MQYFIFLGLVKVKAVFSHPNNLLLQIKRFPQLDTKVIANVHFHSAYRHCACHQVTNIIFFPQFADIKLRSCILKKYLRGREIGMYQRRDLDARKLISPIFNLQVSETKSFLPCAELTVLHFIICASFFTSFYFDNCACCNYSIHIFTGQKWACSFDQVSMSENSNAIIGIKKRERYRFYLFIWLRLNTLLQTGKPVASSEAARWPFTKECLQIHHCK